MIRTQRFTVKTRGHNDVIDITGQVAEDLRGSGVATVFVSGSTAGITTIEFEPGLKKDIKEAYEKIAPENKDYHHHGTWGDDNGSSHVRAAMLGPSLSVPFVEGRLLLGTWQQIILIDFDTRARTREITVQFLGEDL